MPSKSKSESVPAAMQPQYDAIVALSDAFCSEHLNAEYAQLSRQMTAALARKRPSPLLSGKANTWAAGIVHALGTVNFLFDKTQTPHMSAEELAAGFGLSKSTTGNKSKAIRDLLDIGVFDPAWTLPSMIDKNPMIWMITVNGLIVDARSAPRAIQEQAYRLGVIPYIPADRVE